MSFDRLSVRILTRSFSVPILWTKIYQDCVVGVELTFFATLPYHSVSFFAWSSFDLKEQSKTQYDTLSSEHKQLKVSVYLVC